MSEANQRGETNQKTWTNYKESGLIMKDYNEVKSDLEGDIMT